MKPEVELYDTTLRDGSQGEGINFSVMDKLRIAEKLDAFGIHYIEGGWPGSNPKDIEFFAEAKRKRFKNARLAAFGSTRRKQTAVEQDEQVRLLLQAATPVVTLVAKSWLLHVKEVLRPPYFYGSLHSRSNVILSKLSYSKLLGACSMTPKRAPR